VVTTILQQETRQPNSVMQSNNSSA